MRDHFIFDICPRKRSKEYFADYFLILQNKTENDKPFTKWLVLNAKCENDKELISVKLIRIKFHGIFAQAVCTSHTVQHY